MSKEQKKNVEVIVVLVTSAGVRFVLFGKLLLEKNLFSSITDQLFEIDTK